MARRQFLRGRLATSTRWRKYILVDEGINDDIWSDRFWCRKVDEAFGCYPLDALRRWYARRHGVRGVFEKVRPVFGRGSRYRFWSGLDYIGLHDREGDHQLSVYEEWDYHEHLKYLKELKLRRRSRGTGLTGRIE